MTRYVPGSYLLRLQTQKLHLQQRFHNSRLKLLSRRRRMVELRLNAELDHPWRSKVYKRP